MANVDVKEELHGYLRGARETLVWKLDGLGEYDSRRPLTPTGTNLLGLVKHSTATHLAYFGEVFGRSHSLGARFAADAEPTAEFWATPDESRSDIVDGYRYACAFSDATISELDLDAIGQVWWWGDAPVTLHHILVHVTAETQRHAGHADIVRELIDGSVGLLNGADSLQVSGTAEQQRLWERIEAAAAAFR
jgi:hypothetical protein